ncbi:hypothetical protein DM02DRAFT_425692 [Periconia macrospinosa]|uniref:Autophagy-related protein 29 n=1 Tax=Periconia macrospinosa TaxID=97972 RepID=A0A2V1E7Q6_9PLEO|nr:hypothetical protein DM02DRAFT_425692 [Periconia macrospinosa]
MSGVQFTALIRLPFPRGDFIEPPPASWDASKDRSLWRLVSKSSRASELNWVELADNFNVPPAFLLQQAAWLYERHLDHVRAQLKKVGGGASAPLSVDSTHTVMGGVPMKRMGSAGSTASRAPSSLATRPKDNPTSAAEVGTTAPTLSRTPSTNTITQSRALHQQASGRQQTPLYRQKIDQERIERGKNVISAVEKPSIPSPSVSPTARSLSSSSSSESESESDNPVTRSQLFKRPPRFRSHRTRELSAHDEDIEESDELGPGTVLPFANSAGRTKDSNNVHEFSHSKSRVDKLTKKSRETGSANYTPRQDAPSGTEASSSMASSASDAPRSDLASPGPLSPRHRASLIKSSPRRPGNKPGKEGSEGTPSMGSSFSDIDGTWSLFHTP